MDKDIRRADQSCHHLLSLGGWMGKDEKGARNDFEADEEKKLELRLGPPGENWPETNGRRAIEHSFDSVLYLNCSSAGTKRAINPKIEAFEQHQHQHQQQPCFLHLQTNPGFEKEIFHRPNGRPEQQQSIEVKACRLPPPQSANTAGSAAVGHTLSQTRSSTPLVGWPPIRSVRKGLACTSKQAVGSQLGSRVREVKSESSSKSLFVKINMEGIPIGRKVDLRVYESYEKLSLAVNELFRDLLAAQMVPINGNKKSTEKKAISGLLDGSGEYTLVYEDDEGDRMLVGDVPWEMFVTTAKRLHVLKSSELSSSSSSIGTISRKKNPT